MLNPPKNVLSLEEFLADFSVNQLMQMFDLLPDILFWLKNTESQIMYANRAFLEHHELQSLSQILGCCDYDFAVGHLAKQYILDDVRVLNGEYVNERLEMNVNKNGELGWYSTSKRALLNQQNEVIGSYGISRHLDKTSLALTGMQALKKPVEYIRSYYMHDICIKELATLSHLSLSALERRFKKFLNKTPKQYINEVRLENARRLLIESNLPIASVALETGFTDPSYFSRQYKKLFDENPSDLRGQFR